jgi:hypothetical protein
MRTRFGAGGSRLLFGCCVAGAIALVGLPASASATQVTFSYTGAAQSFSVPGVNSVTIDAIGAGGGDLSDRDHYFGLHNLPAGLGGEAVDRVTVTPGQTLQVNVGGKGTSGPYWLASGVAAGGFNGGGDSGPAMNSLGAGGGGGASDVRRGGTTLDDRIIVAAGGGGSTPNCLGGDGGGASGGAGTEYTPPSDPSDPGNPGPMEEGCGGGASGGPGTPSSAGGGGRISHSGVTSSPGGAGALGVGGNGGGITNDGGYVGAGGGGGLYGGGGGASSQTNGYPAGAGGGGSSFTIHGGGMTSGVNSGNGSVTISYLDLSVAVSGRNAVVDDSIHATATLNDASPGSSFVVFAAYGPEDPTCTGTAAFTDIRTISADGTVQSGDFQPQGVGDYRWVVTYDNTATGDQAESPCNDPSTTPGNIVTVAPPKPTDLSFSPGSPSNDNAPRIFGKAFAGSTVSVFTEPDCSGTMAAQGPASDFRDTGLALSVPDNSTTTFYAEVGGGPVGSGCSTESATYVEDSTPPVATIQSTPSALSDKTFAGFSYSSNEAGSTFECALDSGAFASCPASGADYVNLADGTHTFEVEATDRAGNVSDPESFTWVIDTVAPQTTILGGPSGTTSEAASTFSFSSDQPGSTFECRIDDGDYFNCDTPYTTPALAEGPHAFSVRATDPAGNVDPTVALRTFRVQFGAPETTISSGPGGTTSNATPTFTFTSSAPDSTFECRIDDAAYSSCETPYTAPALAEGAHAFSVKATDGDGDTDQTAALRTFTVQFGPPQTTIESGPSGAVHDLNQAFTFSSSKPDSTFECRIDGAAFSRCESPYSVPPLADGPHAFSVRATDEDGDTDETAALGTFNLQTVLVQVSGSTLVVKAPRGTSDNIAITQPTSGSLVVTDGSGATYSGSSLHAGAGCDQTLDSTVTCDTRGLEAIRVFAGDRADRVAGSTALPATVNGVTGDDVLVGGPADDRLVGGPGADSFSGRGGSDRLQARDDDADAKISCGSGSADRASLDLQPKDSPVQNCGTVIRR